MSKPDPARRRQDPKTHRTARPRARRRLRLDEGRQLAAGAARSPRCCAPTSATHLEAENAYTKAMLAATEALQAQMFAEMKGRIKEDDSSVPVARRPLGLLRPLRDRAPSTRSTRAGRAAAATARRCCWTRRRCPRASAFFQVGAASHSPDHAPLRLGRRRAGLGVLPHPGQGPGDRRGAGRAGRERLRRLHLLAGQPVAVLDLARRERPARPRSSAARARRRRTTCWSTRSRTTACSSASGPTVRRQPHRHRRRQPGDHRGAG